MKITAVFKGECPACHCEFECEFTEISYNPYSRGYSISKCPECGYHTSPIGVTRKITIIGSAD